MIIEVRGKPAPQGSKRHVGGGRMVEMSKAVGPWREAVRAETQFTMSTMHSDYPPDGPVEVEVTFRLDRPRSHYGSGKNADVVKPGAPPFPAGRPDLDKLVRAVLDGLTAGGAWKDDSQVVWLQVAKVYCEPWQVPGCTIWIGKAKTS